MINRLFGIIKSIVRTEKIKNDSKNLEENFYFGEFRADCTSFLNTDEMGKIKADAERVLKGEYQIYNFPPYKKLIWNQDPVSGMCVKKALNISLMRTSALFNSADIKNIWEQAHLHPIVTLAQCYTITKDEKYAKKIIEILLDFAVKNPCGGSVAWKCHMDSSIRLANIVQAISQISDTVYFKASELNLHKIIFEHVFFISSDYENKGDFPNNHYLSNLVGVIWGAVYLYKNYRSNRAFLCLQDAMSRLKSEALRQICPDGFDYEFSTYYHCFVSELISETQNLLVLNNINVPIELNYTMKKMIDICDVLGAFEGRLPLIGDQDGSRLFLLKGCFDINRCDFSVLSRFVNWNKKEKRKFGGIYVLNQDDIKVFFKCGDIGTSGKGTHDHNDQLSICVFINGKEIICDSGTFCYTNNFEKRKKFRSVRAHSTVHFNGTEQNDISNIFTIQSNYHGRILQSDLNSIQGEFVYCDGTKHIRSISIKNEGLMIKDVAEGGISRLVLPISYKMIERINDYQISFTVDSIKVTITSGEKIEIQKAMVSKAYGIETEAIYLDSKCFGTHVYNITKEYRYDL